MTISIKKAFEDIKSQRYNKTEFFIYFVIIFAISLSAFFLSSGAITNKHELLKSLGASSIVTIIASIFYSGYLSKMCNNEINQNENIVPSINDFKNTILLGIKYFFCDLALSIILGIIPFILFVAGGAAIFICFAGAFSGFAGLQNHSSLFIILILGVLMFPLAAIVSFVFYYLWGIPLHLNFFKSLDLSDLFDFKKAVELRKTKKEIYHSFIGKAILFWLIFVACYIAIIGICSVIYLISTINYKVTYNDIVSIIASIWSYTAPLLCFPALIGQFFNEEINKAEE